MKNFLLLTLAFAIITVGAVPEFINKTLLVPSTITLNSNGISSEVNYAYILLDDMIASMELNLDIRATASAVYGIYDKVNFDRFINPATRQDSYPLYGFGATGVEWVKNAIHAFGYNSNYYFVVENKNKQVLEADCNLRFKYNTNFQAENAVEYNYKRRSTTVSHRFLKGYLESIGIELKVPFEYPYTVDIKTSGLGIYPRYARFGIVNSPDKFMSNSKDFYDWIDFNSTGAAPYNRTLVLYPGEKMNRLFIVSDWNMVWDGNFAITIYGNETISPIVSSASRVEDDSFVTFLVAAIVVTLTVACLFL